MIQPSMKNTTQNNETSNNMYLAFTTCHPIDVSKSRSKVRSAIGIQHGTSCSLDPSRPVEPSHNLSATDREYLAKVKARIMHSKRMAAAASSGHYEKKGENDETIPMLPDDLDHMEDIIYDRGPENVGQARMFGAWLDESVAGRKAVENTRNKPKNDSIKKKNIEQAEETFSIAVDIFGRGMYIEARMLFSKAAALVDVHTKLGGQYQLWEAQALDACGKKQEAMQLFGVLCSHNDAEIRKVAKELLFILTAPKIQLDKNSFLEIPDIDQYQSATLANNLLNISNFKTFRSSVMEKPPEPHSLQWYLDREKPEKVEDHSTLQVIAIASAIFATLAFMAASPPA